MIELPIASRCPQCKEINPTDHPHIMCGVCGFIAFQTAREGEWWRWDGNDFRPCGHSSLDQYFMHGVGRSLPEAN